MATENDAKPAEPAIMPWQEKYEEKPNQAVSTLGSALEDVKGAFNKLSQGVMPWDTKWKEKPRSEPSRPLPEPVTVSKKESFLNKLVGVESGFNPDAKNPNSSATGLGQFTAGTWTDAVKAAGKDYTLADRKDPEKSMTILRHFTGENEKRAKSDLGRAPTETELYMYHFLGRDAAGDFLKAPPEALAKDYVSSKAARSNRSIFYTDGKPNTVATVLNKFKGKFDDKVVQRERLKETNANEPVVTDPGVNSLLKVAESIPDYKELSSFLSSRNATPDIYKKATGGGAVFEYPALGPKERGEIGISPSNFYSDGKPVKGAEGTLIHEMTHAADRQFDQMVSEIRKTPERNWSSSEKQFMDAMSKLTWAGNFDKNPRKLKQLVDSLDAKWYQENRDYRANDRELRGWAMGNVNRQNDDSYKPPKHLDTTLATEFMMLLDLARKVKKDNGS